MSKNTIHFQKRNCIKQLFQAPLKEKAHGKQQEGVAGCVKPDRAFREGVIAEMVLNKTLW